MNTLKLLGFDTNQIYGSVLLLIALVTFLFPYIYWKRNFAWKRNPGEKTKFLEIWKPSSLFGTILFALLGLGFWFLDDFITYFSAR